MVIKKLLLLAYVSMHTAYICMRAHGCDESHMAFDVFVRVNRFKIETRNVFILFVRRFGIESRLVLLTASLTNGSNLVLVDNMTDCYCRFLMWLLLKSFSYCLEDT